MLWKVWHLLFCVPAGFMLRWSPRQGRPLISEREYSHGEVTGWRRSCSSADTYNMKVQKSAERELGYSQPSAPLLTNAKISTVEKSPGGTWSTVQFFLRKGASKINQITHTGSEKKATQRVISLIRGRDLAIITVSLFLVLDTVSFTSIIHAGLCHSALSCIWMCCLPWCGDLEGTFYQS